MFVLSPGTRVQEVETVKKRIYWHFESFKPAILLFQLEFCHLINSEFHMLNANLKQNLQYDLSQ